MCQRGRAPVTFGLAAIGFRTGTIGVGIEAIGRGSRSRAPTGLRRDITGIIIMRATGGMTAGTVSTGTMIASTMIGGTVITGDMIGTGGECDLFAKREQR